MSKLMWTYSVAYSGCPVYKKVQEKYNIAATQRIISTKAVTLFQRRTPLPQLFLAFRHQILYNMLLLLFSLFP